MNRKRYTNKQLNAVQNKIHEAETLLGRLDFGQLSDLLLDNFDWLADSSEAHELLSYLGRAK